MKSLSILILVISICFSGIVYPKSDDSNDPIEYRCLTFKPDKIRRVLANYILRANGLKTEERQELADKIIQWDLSVRPNFQQFEYVSESGNFVIHYDTVGVDAVPQEDEDNNGIPDYVDSTAYYFDRAYEVEVNQLGFHSPLPDSGKGGSDAYDIYLLELGRSEGTYGFTNTELEIRPDKGYNRWTSYIVMDNDFSPLDSFNYQDKTLQVYKTSGIDAVKITSAHEFHHAIQFIYGIEDRNGLVHEMSSTWMEYRLYPAIKDYYQYLTGLFRYPDEHPFSSGTGPDGYRYSIFLQFMERNYGDESIRRMWELIEDNISGYASIDSLYKERGSSLADEWCEFLQWMYYTGPRAVPGEYFKDAADFPELHFHNELTFIPPGMLADSGSLQPYELRALRVYNRGFGEISDDTLDLVFTNTDTKATIAFLNSNRAYNFYIDESESSGFTPIHGSGLYYYLQTAEDYSCHRLHFYPGGETCSKDFVYPNPFEFSSGEDLFFPAPAKAMLYEQVKLAVYTADMKQIFFDKYPVTVHNGCRVIVWSDIPESISSGVYIYSLEYKGETKLGKFVVHRL